MYLILPTKSIGFRKIMRKFIKFRVNFTWKDSGYIVISMRDDFKTIYCDTVKKVQFEF